MIGLVLQCAGHRRIRGLIRRLGACVSGLHRRVRIRRTQRTDRAAFLNLLTVDDRVLADIGVTREEVERAARLPLEVNAARELRAHVAHRRTSMAECRLAPPGGRPRACPEP